MKATLKKKYFIIIRIYLKTSWHRERLTYNLESDLKGIHIVYTVHGN